MKHLQGIADLGNEAELLRKELSAMRAELKNALEANKDLRDRLLARELGGEKDIREAYKLAVERIKRLEDALRSVDDACCRSEGGPVGPGAEYPDPIPPDPIEITGICRKALEVKP